MFDEIILSLIFILVSLAFIATMRRSQQKVLQQSSPSTSVTSDATSRAQQIAEDIRMTRTSRVVDAVQILDELGETSQGYRHYCELVGTSMAEGGVVAPYSRNQVAYYDIKCYRIDHEGGRDIETLVAHETSISPFWFSDGSSNDQVKVDLASFGNNVILVNSTNHVEGPDSDFSKAFSAKAANATSPTAQAASTRTATAVVGGLHSWKERVAWLSSLRDGATGVLATAFSGQPQLAVAAAGTGPAAYTGGASGYMDMSDAPAHVYFSASAGAGGPGSGRPGSGGAQPGRPGTGGPRGNRAVSGRPDSKDVPASASSGIRSSRPHPRPYPQGGMPMPGGLGDFLGGGLGMGGSPWVMGGGWGSAPSTHGYPHHGYPQHGHPRPRPHTDADDAMAGMMLGMSLGTLLNTLNETTASTTPTSTFRGYRLVENVVPLGSPIYCIGELYRHGADLYMGRSLAKDYPTSYFATKPEAEVLDALGA